MRVLLGSLMVALVIGCDTTSMPHALSCVWDTSQRYQTESIPLCRSRTLLSVATNAPLDPVVLDSLLLAHGLTLDTRLPGTPSTQFIARTLDEGARQRVWADVAAHYTHTEPGAAPSLGQGALVRYAAPVFVYPDRDDRLLLGDVIAVAFDSPLTPSEQAAFAQTHRLHLTPQPATHAGQMYLFTIPRNSTHNALEIANRLYDEPRVQFAEPDFIQLIARLEAGTP